VTHRSGVHQLCGELQGRQLIYTLSWAFAALQAALVFDFLHAFFAVAFDFATFEDERTADFAASAAAALSALADAV
jgi:hypothetical protein